MTTYYVDQENKGHPATDTVHFPGLPSFPQYALAKRQMRQFGGMIAFELKGGLQAGMGFMDALQLVTRAVSLGDAETLAQHPASMTHSTYTPEERVAHGISDGLVRLSIGLEDIEDVLADIAQALDKAVALVPDVSVPSTASCATLRSAVLAETA